MKKPPIIIPVEIFTREFEAKALFACAAAERGHDVYIGSKYEIRTAISRFPAGVFVAKSFASPKARIDRMIRDLGHRIVAWDEEGLVHPDLETYTKRRMSSAALATIDAIFSWGPEYSAFLKSSTRYDGTPVFETGNPRLDLVSDQLRGYHAGRTSQLQETFGRYILINTNFSFVNPDTLDAKGVLSFNLNRKTAHRRSKASPEELAYKGALFRHFIAAAARIARSMPEVTVVIRPHPAESRAAWNALAAAHRNIRVVTGGSVAPWLLGAELLVHNGCTTAVESTLLGKPALCYQPIPAAVSHWQFPNAVSHVARSEDELATLAAAHCNGESRLDVTPAQQRVLLDHVTPATSRLCSDRILDEIDRLGDPPRQIPAGRRMCARAMAHVRTAERLLRQMLPGDIYNAVFQEKRFPATSVADVRDLIGKFAAATGRFRNMEVEPFGKKVFRIRMR